MNTLTCVTVRPPRPVEDRCIVRHNHKFYNNIVVAGIYKLPSEVDAAQISLRSTYIPALRRCLEKHAFLSVVHKLNEKGGREFARVSHVDLSKHINVIEEKIVQTISKGNDLEEDDVVARVLEHIHNDPGLTFFDTATISPAWRMDILPLKPPNQQRVWLSFTYSHHIGDGMSGMILHSTFLNALSQEPLKSSQNTSTIFETQEVELLGVPHLPITPSYLIAPALGHYLPSILSNLLGLRASTSGSDDQTWRGTPTHFSSQSSSPPITTAVEILTISSSTLTTVLQSCRHHNTKLTSLLNGLIAQSLSHHLPLYSSNSHTKNNLIAISAMNLRKACAIPADTVGNFSSAAYTRYDYEYLFSENVKVSKDNDTSNSSSAKNPIIQDKTWTQSAANSTHLAKSASSPKNQAIGLLSWISDIDSWMKGQINKARDASWLVSNLLAFDGKRGSDGDTVVVEKMYFSACADAVGQPLDFNVVSTVGGELVVCVAWQVGALGLDLYGGRKGRGDDGDDGNGTDNREEKRERIFVMSVLDDLKAFLEGIEL